MIFDTVDLSSFTRLKLLELRLDGRPLDKIIPSLVSALSKVASCRLEELFVYCDSFGRYVESLDSLLTVLGGLKDVDAILSRPQFHCLRHVHFNFTVKITMQGHSTASTTSPSTSSSTMIPASSSSSQSSLSDNDSIDRLQCEGAFRHYAEHLIRSKIREELKHLNLLDTLDIKLDISIVKDTPKMDTNTETGQTSTIRQSV